MTSDPQEPKDNLQKTRFPKRLTTTQLKNVLRKKGLVVKGTEAGMGHIEKIKPQHHGTTQAIGLLALSSPQFLTLELPQTIINLLSSLEPNERNVLIKKAIQDALEKRFKIKI